MITRATPPSVTLTSPVGGTTIDTTSFAAAGTYTDPNGEIASIILTFDGMTPAGTAVLDGSGGFTATVDATGVTNGAKTLLAIASDMDGNMVAMASVNISCTAGVTGYSVTLTVDYDGTPACDGYLTVTLILPDYSGMGGMLLGVPVTSADFPFTATIEGVPAGDYVVSSMVTVTSDPSSASVYESSYMAPVEVSVVDTDITVTTTDMMYEAF